MDQAKIAAFRKKIVEDESFRAAFAESPSDALRSIGIPVPNELKLPSIDRSELDRQVEDLKKAAGGNLDQLYAAGELSEKELDQVSGGLSSTSPQTLQQNRLFQFSNRLQRIQPPDSKGTVYTITAISFGVLDW